MDSTAPGTHLPPGAGASAADFEPPAAYPHPSYPERRRPGTSEEARWLHELSNEVSTASVASAVLRRMLERGQIDQALQFTRELDSACSRCASLVQARYQTLS